MTYFSYINNVKKFLMNTNNKLNKANSYRLSQELLRNKALKNGVNLVAPVSIGKNSVVGAGSVITKNVKKKSLALTRASQISVTNYKRKKK